MFYVRSPAEGGQESIAKGLSVLWLVMRFVFLLLNIILRFILNLLLRPSLFTVVIRALCVIVGHSCTTLT